MPKFTLDTNVLVDALRLPAALGALKDFLKRALPVTFLSAVVLQELEAGARSGQAALLEQLIGPFDRRGRVFTPTLHAWRHSGRILAKLRRGQRSAPLASVTNDLLLAVSCREAGITVITRDADLRRLVPHVSGLQVTQPYPPIA